METVSADALRHSAGTAIPVPSSQERLKPYRSRQELGADLRQMVQYDATDTSDNRYRIDSALTALGKIKAGVNSRYEVRVHRDSGKIQIHLVDWDSGEVVERIPSSRLLEFYGSLESLSGLLLEKQV